MTPPALTPAARGTTSPPRPKSPGSPAARGQGHRPQVRRGTSPRAPRRVSGPTGGAAASGAIAAPAPARVTNPARPRPRPATGARPRSTGTRAPWRLRSAAYVRRLPDHALLDRIIRGRAWIPLLGLLLVGIVAMQVEVLKLNAGIGRSLERGSALQAQNELLRASVARLSDEQRIEKIAAQMGMVMPAPDQLKFVSAGPGAVERALGAVHAPDSAGFLARLPAIGAPAAAQGTSTNLGVGLAATGTASAASTTPSAAGASSGATTASGTAPSSIGSTTTGAGTTASTSPNVGTTGSTAASVGQTGSTSASVGTTGSTAPGSGTTASSGTGTAGSSGAASTGTGSSADTPGLPAASSQSGSSTGGGTPIGG